jgi:DNA-directed RNA polymerase subunit RPC12/RpoP
MSVIVKTDTRVMYRCDKCGFEWKMEPSERPVICPCDSTTEMKLVPEEGLAWQQV